ncbi:MAG TPA: DNA-processing protein DprA [Spirochaetia bacterium]|nr:DNA-processing protein DprA [Spirochaetia bacterium]
MAEPALMLAVHSLESLHTLEKLKIIDAAGNAESFAHFSRFDIERSVGRQLRIANFDPGRLVLAAESDLKYLTQAGIAYTFYWSDDYPPLLREIYDPPLVLFYRGRLPDPENPLLAIVGTRRPTSAGLRSAFTLGREVAAAGIPVVSGLARGIDAAAHEGALAAGGGTIAVLGSGIDTVYPMSNRRLAGSIIGDGGCIVSEYPPGVPPLKYHFPARNRIIAGLSRGVVVVEAPNGSGALITADFCIEQGRDLFVHRTGIEGPNCGGCASLSTDGARIIDGAADVLRDWERSGRPNVAAPGERQLPLEFCEVGTGPQIGRAMAVLMERELNGEITKQFGAFFRRSD